MAGNHVLAIATVTVAVGGDVVNGSGIVVAVGCRCCCCVVADVIF